MAKIKAGEVAKKTISVDDINQKTNNPLIFISHDSRDEELAEEFSNLLKRASAGVLKSFVSSDKKGGQGIQYGTEWYPAIMKKIEEASDVICLLTTRSVERPWILYEAGVAKGKLDKKVIGIALGIQHTIAFTGPFAQFQNNDGSVPSITKLIIDLIRKVPNTDPDELTVKSLVQEFSDKAKTIIKKNGKVPVKTFDLTNENVIPNLFEEIKIMFENLPRLIQKKISSSDSGIPRYRTSLEVDLDFLEMGSRLKNMNLAFLMCVTMFRSYVSWIHEYGVQIFNELETTNDVQKRIQIVLKFQKAVTSTNLKNIYEFVTENDRLCFDDIITSMYRFLDNFLLELGHVSKAEVQKD